MQLANHKLPELLSPAGSFSHLKAAVRAGADAIYMGGEKFSARAYADNFDNREGLEAIGYAHFHGRRVYMTVNTLMKQEELEGELYDFLLPYQEAGLDGVIVQDIGTASFIRGAFPDLELHGSTQMTITDLHGARAAGRLGMNRVVPARELSLDEIRTIKKATGLEVEVFIHGALCCSYSGQCLLSSAYGGRSGNRGRCAQPCRLPYQLVAEGRKTGPSSCYLSPRDLCSLEELPSLIKAGVDSLKIEGRMKSEEYVAGVTSIYRKYLDHWMDYTDGKGILIPDPEDRNNLEELYCRTDFTDGYWNRHNGPSMMSMDTPRNTGHQVGKVKTVSKKQVTIDIREDLYPKDILVIFPNRGNDEVVLTVPGNIAERTSHKRGGKTVTLNLPASSGIRPGDRVCRRRKDPLIAEITNTYIKTEPKLPVKGTIILHPGQKARLEVTCQGITTAAEGNPVELSKNRPVTMEVVDTQLRKTGTTAFYFEELGLEVEEGIFLPMSELKQLRRECFNQLEEKMRARKPNSHAPDIMKAFDEAWKKQAAAIKSQPSDMTKGKGYPNSKEGFLYKPEIIVTLTDRDLMRRWIKAAEELPLCILLPMDFLSEEEILSRKEELTRAGVKSYLSLPRIMRAHSADRLSDFLSGTDWEGVYAHNINQAQFLYEQGQTLYASPSLYHWNSRTIKEMNHLFPNLVGFSHPMELSGREIHDLLMRQKKESNMPGETELTVYGRLSLMITAQCLKKNVGRCDHQPGLLHLKNPKGLQLPVTNHCRECYNIVWSDSPRNLIGIDLHQLPMLPDRISIDLSMEDSREADRILDSLTRWMKAGFGSIESFSSNDSYWNRGIE